jgi:beta-lactamase class A
MRSALKRNLILTLVVALVLASNAAAQDAHRAILAGKFQKQLDAIADSTPGVLGIQVVDIDGKQSFGVNQDLVFPQGSAIKVALLAALYVRHARGEVDAHKPVWVRAQDRVSGSTILQYLADNTTAMSPHDLSVPMIVLSDNMATNILIDIVGMDHVNRIMSELELPNTKLQRKMIRPQESARGNENISTPAEAARLMQRIRSCDLPMSREQCAEMLAVLRIPHDGPIQDSVPSGIPVAQKTGSITGVRTSWGAVDLPGRPYALAVMGNYGDTNVLSGAIRNVADAAFAYFSKLAGATPYGTRVPVRPNR